MLKVICTIAAALCRYRKLVLLSALIGSWPALSAADIIWDGNFHEKTFYPTYNPLGEDYVAFFYVPNYGRPPQTFDGKIHPDHVGNGDLLSLEASPTRGSKFSAKFTIKNSENGKEPNDCDPATDCSNRRSQIQMTNQFSNVLPYRTERWLSFSAFLPRDFGINGGGFDLVIWGSKPYGAKTAGWLGIKIANGGWEIAHRFNDNGVGADYEAYWKAVHYSKDFPDSTSSDALADYPDPAASRAALANLNRGGWTDFIIHFRMDTSDYESNIGFLDIYMRAGEEKWVHVLNVLPKRDFEYLDGWAQSHPERIYDRGIGTLAPEGTGSNIGLYADKKSVWTKSGDTVLYFDNYKVGDERTTFEQMTPDTTSIVREDVVRPNAPVLQAAD